MNRRDRTPEAGRQVGEGKPFGFSVGGELHGGNFAHREVSHNRKIHGGGVQFVAKVAPSWGMAKTLHQYLKAHRKLRGFTQEHVANILGVSHNSYSMKESGQRPVDLEELEKLAEAYGIHPVALLMAPQDGPRADLVRRAAEIARTRSQAAAEAWLQSGEHMPPAEESSHNAKK